MRARLTALALLVLLVPGEQAAARAAAPTWSPPLLVSPTGVLEHAAMAGDTAVLAWVDGTSVVAAYRSGEGAWDVDVLGEGSRPRVAVNASGRAAFAWQVGDSVRVSIRDDVAWGYPAELTAARFPATAVNAAGVVRVLALGWDTPAPERTDVRLFSYDGAWSAGRQLNRRPLENRAALRRSLTLTSDGDGNAVAGWLCPAVGLVPAGDPEREGWVCVDYPGSHGEFTSRSPSGVYAVSAPKRRPIHIATPDGLAQAWPGMLDIWAWYIRPPRTAQIALDVYGRDGVAAWRLAGTDGELRVVTRRGGEWRGMYRVARHTHGLAGATLAEPHTALAFWRTADGRLATASKVGKGDWRRSPDMLGDAVERARLVSDQDGDALLAWSSADGVRVSSR